MPIGTSCKEPVSVPAIDRTLCTDCLSCARICPSETLREEAGKVAVTAGDMFGCIGCAQCMAVCAVDAVTVKGRDVRPGDSVPLPAFDPQTGPAQLEALMLKRRSIRRFQDREVPPELVAKVLEAASTAPMGIPPSEVQVHVWQGRAKVHKFAQQVVDTMRGSLRFMGGPLFKLMMLMMKPKEREQMKSFILPLLKMITANWDEGRDVLFYDAPVALLFHTTPYADPSDAMIAATYAMLAAEALGLGNIMIGSAGPLMKFNKKLLAELAIPAENKLPVVLLLGYAETTFHRAIKRRLGGVKYI
jgi:nitroreductase/Pyruvate/2-oxoacid:ferredoxin oxidoreductase delta subunit